MNFSCNELVKTFDEDATKSKNKCLLISQGIQNGSVTIFQLIEQLREVFINPSPSKRETGVLILTEVLQNLPPDFLNAQQVQVIVSFYVEKFGDHHQILPIVLRGLLTIIGFKYFPEKCIISILNGLFHNIACQQQQQADRRTIYEILQLSLQKYKEALLSMKLDLVYGILSSIDGERDPRNLMFLFKWLQQFLTMVQLGHLTEEMFEVMACYFPVDFKTPPSDKKSITREDLANELCPCLCAIPEFAEYCIPLALEKLDSSLQIAKIDSLKLLKEGCQVFSSMSYFTYATEIWSQIQKEIFSETDRIVKDECLSTLSAVINKISQMNNGHLRAILNNITTTLKGNILQESKLFEPSISILLYTAVASQESSVYVIHEIIPLLTNTFIISQNPLQKAVILKASVDFVKIHLKYKDMKSLENDELEIIPKLCLKYVEMETTSQSTCYDCLADLAESLSQDVRLLLYEKLHSAIIKTETADIRNSILKCFKKISIFYPNEINTHVLYKSKIFNPIELNMYLNALCVLTELSYFNEIVTECFISYALDEVNMASISLKNMRILLGNECKSVELVKIFLEKQFLHKLIEYSIVTYTNGNVNIDFLSDVSSVLKTVIGSQDFQLQNEIINDHLNVTKKLFEESKELYVMLLDGLTSRVCKGLTVESNTLIFLTRMAILNDNVVVRDVSTQLLANLINKYPEGDDFNTILDNIKEESLIHMDTCRYNVFVVFSWILKALVMRNHCKSNAWTDMLLQYLEEDKLVAQYFRIIINDNYESLSSKSYCNKMLLYQQKFFVQVTNKMCADFGPGKMPYCLAVGYLMESVPEQPLFLQFKKISKLVILCLNSFEEPEVQYVILQKIKQFLIHKEEILNNNIEDLLLAVLGLTDYQPSMKIRIAALQCLNLFSFFPLYKMLPFKQQVLNKLGFSINDHKRLVRKEAMEARLHWFLLDAPI